MASFANVNVARDLAAIVGEENVCEQSAPLTAFAIDGVKPSLWVVPGTVEEIAAVLRVANAFKLTVTVAGGFSHQSMGNAPTSVDILLRMDRMNQVLHFDPGDLTIGVEAGCKVEDVRKKVAEDSLMLPLEIAKGQTGTIGGALATAVSGPMKHGFGGVREYCIGVSFVTGAGRIAKAGGRVVKNVAGYDVMKLMIGSQGTLGVITSANFRLFPAPKQTRTFIAEFEDAERALAYRDVVQASPLSPMCLELVSPRARDYIGGSAVEHWAVAVRGAGSDAVLERYRKELGESVAKEYRDADEELFWHSVREFPETVQKRHQNAMGMTIHVAPSELHRLLKAADECALSQNMLFASVGRAATATLDAAFIPISVDPPSVTQYAHALSELRKRVPRDAAVIVTRCPREAKAYFSVWGSTSSDIEAMKAVKQALDPNGILNRGRFLF